MHLLPVQLEGSITITWIGAESSCTGESHLDALTDLAVGVESSSDGESHPDAFSNLYAGLGVGEDICLGSSKIGDQELRYFKIIPTRSNRHF